MERSSQLVNDAFEKVENLLFVACFAVKISCLVAQEAYAKTMESEFVEVAKEKVGVATETVSDIVKSGLDIASDNLHVIATKAAKTAATTASTAISSTVNIGLNVMATMVFTSIFFAPSSLKRMTSLSLHSVLRACPGNLCTRRIHVPKIVDVKDFMDDNFDADGFLDSDWDLMEIPSSEVVEATTSTSDFLDADGFDSDWDLMDISIPQKVGQNNTTDAVPVHVPVDKTTTAKTMMIGGKTITIIENYF